MKKALLSLVATGAIALGTIFLKDGGADIVWRVVHAHGVFPYVVVFFSFWTLLVSLSEEWRPNRMQALPCFWGAFGFLWEQGRSLFEIYFQLSGAWDGFSPKGFAREVVLSIAQPFEIFLLGAGMSLIFFTITACVITYRGETKV